MLSIKLVDVNTASVERQKTQVITAKQLLGIVEPMTLELMGGESTGVRQTPISVAEKNPPQAVSTVVTKPSPQTSTLMASDRLVAKGMSVYQNSRKLNSSEVQQVMWANSEALESYWKGKSKNKTGNTLIITGGVATIIGIGCTFDGVDNKKTAMSAGGALLSVAGVVGVTYGFVMKSSGKKLIRNAVDSYNRTNHTSQVEFDFGLTHNGIGLVMRF